MAMWRRFLFGAGGALSLLGAGSVSAGASEGTLVEFDSMTAVTGAALGPATDRGIPGGGAPWSIVSATGSVDRQGNVSVTVKGLIVVPLNRNPIGTFEAVVSCITPDGIRNVQTTGAGASMAGGSTIHATVGLPHPCKSPVVVVRAAPRGTLLPVAEADRRDY